MAVESEEASVQDVQQEYEDPWRWTDLTSELPRKTVQWRDLSYKAIRTNEG